MVILHQRTQQPGARRRGLLATLALLALTLLALSACGAEAPEPSATPTKTLRPTFTPTSAAIAMATQTADAAATEAARATSTPTATPTATATPIPTDTPVPPTATPEPPTATPAPPTATPRPVVVVPPTAVPTQPPPPPPAQDAAECAAIGGDGCKFRIRSGPASADNGGGELKLQLFFIHSGVDGGQPQGDYRVWLEKDGQKLPGFDDARSIALSSQQGSLGRYNYEHSVGVDRVPGNTVAGSYVIWVLDGNRERDSLNFTFALPEGHGLVWIEFDQG
jgi:hypothetical protein